MRLEIEWMEVRELERDILIKIYVAEDLEETMVNKGGRQPQRQKHANLIGFPKWFIIQEISNRR